MALINEVLKAGWYLHPVYRYDTKQVNESGKSRRKTPLLPSDWKTNSSNDYQQIHDWHTTYKAKLNENPAFGVVLGKKSGIFVLDVDTKNGAQGAQSLEKLEELYGSLRTNNFYVNTPSGGVHIYLRLPEGKELLNRNKLKKYPGIEIKSTGTYVLLFDDGYIPQNGIDVIPECPEWIDEMWSTDGEQETTEEDIPNERNNYLTSRCGEIRTNGLNEDDALEQLLTINNDVYSNHPEGPLPEKEVRTICKSCYRYDKPDDFSDHSIAEKIYHLLDEDICYITEFREFYLYKEGIWQLDKNNLTGKIIYKLVPELMKYAAGIKSKQARKIYARKIKALGNVEGHAKAITVLKDITARSIEDFDKEQYIICINNGIINLKTHEFLPHDKKYFFTRKMNCIYDIDAQCPKYDRFMVDTFGNDINMIKFVERLIGLALTGDSGEQIFPILWGKGENGKTVLTVLMGLIFKDYASTCPGIKLMNKESSSANDYFLADLKAKRIVIASETPKNALLDSSMIKYATGSDTIKARPIYGKPFEFKQQYIMFLMTNDKPKIRDTSHGMWRRVKLIPFEHQVDPNSKILKLEQILFEEENSGILNRWLDGLKDYQANGFCEPEKVKIATSEYRDDENLISGFVKERCTINPEFQFSLGQLYKSFKNWYEENGERGGHYLSSKQLLNEIKRMYKIECEHTRSGNIWKGLGINQEENSEF